VTVGAILKSIADVVFPPRCTACGSVLDEPDGRPFCPTCFSLIRNIESPLCPCCGIPLPDREGADHFCGECLRAHPPFSSARAVARYESVLLDAIHGFKYRGRITDGEVLGKMMADYRYHQFDISAYTLIVPVPLHRRRLRERGFNQAVILAREIAGRFSLPIDLRSLRRRVYTEPQVGLGKGHRTANVRGAFDVGDGKRIEGQKIVLVDDVYTTGGTVRECAGILMKNKAAEVAVLTLARAV
jgi:ComF family protein